MNAEPGGTSEIVGIVVAFVILLITFCLLYRVPVCQLLVQSSV